jgi:hypothetical protein
MRAVLDAHWRADAPLNYRPLNPAAIILSKQLPLFLAELHSLDQPRGGASDIFGLYSRVGALLQIWDELCPG